MFVLVDSSVEETQKLTQLLNRLAIQLNVGSASNRIALAQFGEDVSVQFLFNAYKNKNEALALISKFQLRGTGQRMLGKAMDFVRTHLLNTKSGSRIAQGYKQYLLVVSKGESDDNILRAVRALKDEEVTLFSVDLSKEIDMQFSPTGSGTPGPRGFPAKSRQGVPFVYAAKHRNVTEITEDVKTVIGTKEMVKVTGGQFFLFLEITE